MTTLPENVRGIALILGSVLIAGPLVTVLASAARAPRHVAAARLCLQSEATGLTGPCLVVPAGIA